jgi:hypothetical protein
MNSSEVVIHLVEMFKRQSLKAFTKPLSPREKERKRVRRLLVRESEVWESAARIAAIYLEPAEPKKRTEPGSSIEKQEGEPLSYCDLIEISEDTGIKESKVRVINLLLSLGKTRRETSEAAGVSMKKLQKLIRMFPRLGSYPD